MKALGILVILFNLIFAQEIKSDSSALNPLNLLKRQNLLYSAGENWIPPSLPSESECISGGCCLMPLGGFFIMREALKQEVPLESLQPAVKPKFSIGISYSPGIALTGGALVGPQVPGLGIPPPENVLALFYLNNRVEIDAQYHFDSHWALGIDGGYMWVKLNGRNPWFSPRDTLENEVKSLRTTFWEISTFCGLIGLSYRFVNGKRMGYIGGGLEYNIAEALSHGEWVIYYPADYFPSDTIEYTGKAFRWGRGGGVFMNIGFFRPITKRISLNIAWTVRYSLAKEYEWKLPPWAVLDKPITYSFTGLYLKVGFTYIMFKKQTNKGEK
ncbi:MAG: hypothetical protein ABIL74_05620 [candidate division WOR-3 bacterium]